MTQETADKLAESYYRRLSRDRIGREFIKILAEMALFVSHYEQARFASELYGAIARMQLSPELEAATLQRAMGELLNRVEEN